MHDSCPTCAHVGHCIGGSVRGEGRDCARVRRATHAALIGGLRLLVLPFMAAAGLVFLLRTFRRFYRYFRRSGYSVRRAAARAWAKACEADSLPLSPTLKGKL